MDSTKPTENRVPVPTTEELIQVLNNFLSGNNEIITIATQFLK